MQTYIYVYIYDIIHLGVFFVKEEKRIDAKGIYSFTELNEVTKCKLARRREIGN